MVKADKCHTEELGSTPDSTTGFLREDGKSLKPKFYDVISNYILIFWVSNLKHIWSAFLKY